MHCERVGKSARRVMEYHWYTAGRIGGVLGVLGLIVGLTTLPARSVAQAYPNCGNGVVDAGEDCDGGGICIGGTNAGTACLADAQCSGGHCTPFGGDGCAANCTFESAVPVERAGVNVWTSHGPPGAVNVYALAFDPTAPGTLYIGSGDSRLFRTTDGGVSWSTGSTPLPQDVPVIIDALAIDPSTPSTLYAGTEGGTSGIIKSTDAGVTWSAINTGLTHPDGLDVFAIAIDPTTPTTLYAVTLAGVFKSTNAGGEWQATGLRAVSTIAIDASTPGTLYAGGQGVFKSTDAGSTWEAVSTSAPDLTPVFALAIDPATPTTLYAGKSDFTAQGAHGGVFKSTDGGTSWQAVNTGLPSDMPGVVALAIDPTMPTRLFAGTSAGVFESSDGAGSWQAATAGLTGILANGALALDARMPRTLYAGTNAGLFKTTHDGGTWSAISTTAVNDLISMVAVDPTSPDTLYAASGAGNIPGVFKSTDRGLSWQSVNSGLHFVNSGGVDRIAVAPTTPSVLYAVTHDVSDVFKSIDGGTSWQEVSAGLPLTQASSGSVFIDPRDPNTLYFAREGGAHSGVYKSTDGGETWSLKNKGLTNPYVAGIAIDPTTPNTLYAASAAPTAFFKSTDGATSWLAVGSPQHSGSISVIAMDPATPSRLYAGMAPDGGLFKSTDSGATWSASDSGLPTGTNDTSFVGLVIDPNTPSTLYAAVGTLRAGVPSGGVFKSTDSGESWAALGTGLPATGFVNGLAIDPSNPRTLYAATDNGVFDIEQVGVCVGDCGGTGSVAITDLVTLVSIVLGNAQPSACPHGVPDGTAVDITMIIQAVGNALTGCG